VHWRQGAHPARLLARLFDNKAFLVAACLFPAVSLLLVFLTYPLGLGIFLAFTDTTIGRTGVWVGLGEFRVFLFTDPIF
jgi:multiple sugar transport system permease protein